MVTFFTTSFFTGLVSYLLTSEYLGIVPLSKENATAMAFLVGISLGALASYLQSREEGTDMEY